MLIGLQSGQALRAQASATQAPTPATAADQRTAEIQSLREQLQRISARLDKLEAEEHAANPAPSATPIVAASTAPTATPPTAASSPTTTASTSTPAAASTSTLATAEATVLRGTTLSFDLDGYYAYNTNQPIGRVNLLRAYDVSSNSFSINQVGMVIEHKPLPEPGHRAGGRIDLQFGQATETLQGSSSNELRPQVWRNLFQAYGSYLAPIGSGLQLDFGKFASSLGVEGNYSKDQLNYSRSFLFDYLPFYHMGLRANYNLTPKVNVAYWLVNGAQQTEDFNGFKSQAFLFTLQPASSVTWTVNYYFGEEQRDVVAVPNPVLPAGPTQPGLPTANITPTPNGREHIFDTYATWTATPHLTLIGEADFVVNRVSSTSQPERVAAGAIYARYALPHQMNLAARAEYFDDRSGLYSGAAQALKEFTFTWDRQLQPNFLVRAEYRRDMSNQPFFLTAQPGLLLHHQDTATLGLIYWWGQKDGSW